MGIFTKVASRVADIWCEAIYITQIVKVVPVLSSETFLNTEDISKTGQAGFKIKLGALS